MRTIYFDMDGTFVNLYGVENWLDYLLAEDTTPYDIAKPLFRMSDFARTLHKVQEHYNIGIITWCCKGATKEYDEKVAKAKLKWLSKHLGSVQFNEIHILKYGTPKESVATNKDILFDDEVKNRENWKGVAYDVDNILEILRAI